MSEQKHCCYKLREKLNIVRENNRDCLAILVKALIKQLTRVVPKIVKDVDDHIGDKVLRNSIGRKFECGAKHCPCKNYHNLHHKVTLNLDKEQFTLTVTVNLVSRDFGRVFLELFNTKTFWDDKDMYGLFCREGSTDISDYVGYDGLVSGVLCIKLFT